MNFLTRSSRVRAFAFAVVIWAAILLASDLEQNNQPVRSPDTPVLIWDIDLKLTDALPRNVRTTDEPLKGDGGEASAAATGRIHACIA